MLIPTGGSVACCLLPVASSVRGEVGGQIARATGWGTAGRRGRRPLRAGTGYRRGRRADAGIGPYGRRLRNRYSSSSVLTFSGISRLTGQTAAFAIRFVKAAMKALSFSIWAMDRSSGRS